MKLTSVAVTNFRLLKHASVALDTDGATTVFVGPNNSGKTSLAEAVGLFIGAPTKLSINDFSITTYAAFTAFERFAVPLVVDESAPQSDAPAAASSDAPEEPAAPEPAPPALPSIRVTLGFEYTDAPEDLRVVDDLLMDLDEQSYQVAIQLEFGVHDPGKLIQDYRTRRETSKDTLVQFLAERLADHYALQIYKISPDGSEREPIDDRTILAKLIRIDFMPAQRHMEDQESGAQATRLSRLLNTHYERRHKVDDPASYEELDQAVRAQSIGLTGRYAAAFEDFTKSLLLFGVPSTPNLTIRAEMSASAIFRDNTRVYYGAEIEAQAHLPAERYDLPERYNGLGFKNLIYMVLQLKAFQDDMRSAEGPRPRVHLIIIEEPEAHLHPQMQTVFIEKAGGFLSDGEGGGAQLILTTHSSHIVATCGFAPIRYFRRRGATAVVRDLLAFRNSQTDPEKRRAVDFLSRYLTLTRCDLFFCDKAILIEGAVERLVLPKMIAQAKAAGIGDLTSTYLAVIEVGGAYAHAFKDLVSFIGVPTLIVTDLDSVGEDRKKCPVAAGYKTSNATLKSWLPAKAAIADLLVATDVHKTEGQVRVTYQVPDAAHLPCGRSFEEAFVYANADWLIANKPLLIATGACLDADNANDLRTAAYDLDLPKVDFALDLIGNEGWVTPKYIADGLTWLAAQPA